MTHLSALLTKNWILWKRNLLCSCCELLLPTILIFALIGIRSAVVKENVPEMSYVQMPFFKGGPSTMYAGVFKQLQQQPGPGTETGPGIETNTTMMNDMFVQTNNFSIMRNCINNSRRGASYRNGQVALIPPTNPIIQTIQGYLTALDLTTRMFDTNQALNDYIIDSEYGLIDSKPYLCFGIEMIDSANGKYTYALHYNVSAGPGMEDVADTIDTRTNPIKTEDITKEKKWIDSGWLTVQNWIDNLILRQETGDQGFNIQSSFTSIRVPAFLNDAFPSLLKGSFGIYLVLPLMIIYLRMTYALLYEKEKKLKEGMKMMGLSNSSFYLSWIITYIIIYTIISIIATILLSNSVFPNTSPGIVFIVYWLFTMVLIFQSIFISVFFTRALFGLIVAIVFYLLQFMVVTLIGSEQVYPSSSLWAASISSHAALSFAFDVMIQFEGSQKGVSFSNLGTAIDNYSVSIAITMDILSILFYLVFGLYLDQVFPNEWGKKKHPLFFLQCFKRSSSKVDKEKNLKIVQSDDGNNISNQIEEVEQMLKDQEARNECLTINNLYKVYDTGKKAVSNLSLQIYSGQIFVLLGHNGAGKTSTISMLTGMLEISRGNANAYGKDVETEMNEIRQFMGVCPQHDILFDNLTVKEHLVMFSTFKGNNAKESNENIEKMIEDVDLTEKTDYLAKNLSGGQRRRLSVAIAFIGNSKLIYLDEPTSGMDTSARRYIWTMLKNYKSNRIIVLTTHFMDEADFLGDRIGIMGEGKLICCGSSVFLKNEFGVGYNLTMVKQDPVVDSIPIIKLIHQHIPSAKVLSNVSAEVAFQLPLATVTEFPKLFEDIDKNLVDLKVNSYGISITTLEEVFLKVAQIGAGHKQVNDYKDDEKDNLLVEKADDFDINSIRIFDQKTLFITHTIALIMKRVRYFKRDLRSLFCEIILPCLIVIVGLALMTITILYESTPLTITPENFTWKPTQVSWAGAVEGSSYFDQFDTTLYKVNRLQPVGDNQMQQLMSSDQLYYKSYNIRQDLGWYFVEVNSPNNINIAIFGNSVQAEAYPMLLNQMNQAILRKTTDNPKAQIKIINSPFPLSLRSKDVSNTISGFIGAFVFSIGMSFIPASVISYIIKEREINIKHQQLVSGVSVHAYWFSNFIMDVGKHLIPAVFCPLMVIAFDITTMLDSNYGAVWLLFFLYGWAIIPFCYAFGFLFRQQGNGLLISFFLHLISGALLSVIFWVLRLIESTRSVSKVIAWFIRLIPSFSFAFGIINLSNRSIYATVEGGDIQDVYDFSVAGGDILMLALEGFFYIFIVFFVERMENSGQIQQLGSKEKSIPYQQKVLDDDVLKEIENCDKLDQKTQAVLVQNIRKVFMLENGAHKTAVDQISFSVSNGEVFGLLGVNGAGKTTTFKILSGEIKPTSGQAFIAGHNIITNITEARRNIGYCAQFDGLLENLTVLEHLELYTIIKGIPNHMQVELVNKKLKEMDLDRFRFIQTGQLSGGNKRKLSVAIAMIGNPPIVFLDEPSTGMDPEARRFMWNVISRIATERKQSSIILTTHSMEEAEALSTKIAIQVEGNLYCIGSVQHIKNKFGSGYEIEVKIVTPTREEIQTVIKSLGIAPGTRFKLTQVYELLDTMKVSFLKEQISINGYGSQIFIDLQKSVGISIESLVEYIQVEIIGQSLMKFIQDSLGPFDIIEHFQTFYRFRLKVSITVGKLFGQFEKNKSALKISQYSIKQASIEQIFNTFATKHLEIANVGQVQVNIPVK